MEAIPSFPLPKNLLGNFKDYLPGKIMKIKEDGTSWGCHAALMSVFQYGSELDDERVPLGVLF